MMTRVRRGYTVDGRWQSTCYLDFFIDSVVSLIISFIFFFIRGHCYHPTSLGWRWHCVAPKEPKFLLEKLVRRDSKTQLHRLAIFNDNGDVRPAGHQGTAATVWTLNMKHG